MTIDLFEIKIPQIKRLTFQDIINETKTHVGIDKFMLSLAEEKQPDRDFVCNLICINAI